MGTSFFTHSDMLGVLDRGDPEELPIIIRPATAQDIPAIVTMVNRFAAQNVMLPRTEASVQQTLAEWWVAVDTADHVDANVSTHNMDAFDQVSISDKVAG